MRISKKNNLPIYVRLIFTAFVFVVSCLCLLSMLVPPSQLKIEKAVPQTDDIVATVNQSQIKGLHNCEIDDEGNVTITGGDAYIVFSGYGENIQAVRLNFIEPVSENFYAVLYFDKQDDFNELNTKKNLVLAGDSDVCFHIAETQNTNLRIDIDSEYTFKDIELHSKAPNILYDDIKVPIEKYIISTVVALIVAICFFVFDNYVYPVTEKVKDFYLKNYKEIFAAVLKVLVAMLISVAIEFIVAYFFYGVSSTGRYFNEYRCLFICGIVSALTFIVSHIKNKEKGCEKLFAILMLHIGIVMIFCSPFGHICWDFDSHSKFVLTSSYIGEGYKSEADDLIFTNREYYNPKDNAANNIANIEYLNEAGTKLSGKHASSTTIAHLPIGTGVAVSRFLGATYVAASNIGRLLNLITCVLVCYLAMKKLKSGKMILATIALLPTNMFLMTSYAYDAWVTSFVFLGVAYFISEIQQPDKSISAMDTFIMCLSLILACLPKQIYMPLMIIPFFMYKKWKTKGERNKYYIICFFMTVLMFALLMIRAFSSVTSGGDTRGGSEVNSMEQVKFILGEPFNYARILLRFLGEYLSVDSMKTYINYYAYMGFGTQIVTWIFIACIMFTTLTDKNEYDRFKGKQLLRIINILIFIGLAALVATSLYISFTPVRNATVEGCQPRYIIPLLFPLLAVLTNPGIVLKIKKQIYDISILTVLSAAVFWDIEHVLLSRLM
ncbi:MAG: DUF2142 domain-containing protein [Clostridia bacterium]|nr:DUF2142 domain-containing protein [Clostridia bacterium]